MIDEDRKELKNLLSKELQRYTPTKKRREYAGKLYRSYVSRQSNITRKINDLSEKKYLSKKNEQKLFDLTMEKAEIQEKKQEFKNLYQNLVEIKHPFGKIRMKAGELRKKKNPVDYIAEKSEKKANRELHKFVRENKEALKKGTINKSEMASMAGYIQKLYNVTENKTIKKNIAQWKKLFKKSAKNISPAMKRKMDKIFTSKNRYRAIFQEGKRTIQFEYVS